VPVYAVVSEQMGDEALELFVDRPASRIPRQPRGGREPLDAHGPGSSRRREAGGLP
jgi:hypothetical protein